MLHGTLLAIAFAIFAYRVALPAGLIAGALGAIVGVVLAQRLIAQRYRLLAVVGYGVAVLVAGLLSTMFVSSSAAAASAIGPPAALQLTEVLRWGPLTLGGTLVLRALSLRYRVALALEGAVVVLAVAATVAAHRDGMIARPLTVSDWFWTQGVDPVLAFLALGLVGGVLLAAILAYGRSPGRTLGQLGLVLLLGIYLASKIHGADEADRRSVTGDALEKDDEKQTRSGGGSGGEDDERRSEGKQSPFDDGLPKAGDSDRPQNRPAAIVVLHNDVVPSNGVFYFRHAAFSQYNGVRLIEATTAGVDVDVPRAFPRQRAVVSGVPEGAYGRTDVATDVALLEDHARMFSLIDPIEAAPRANPAPARFRRAYSTVASVLTSPFDELMARDPGDPEWTDDAWEHYTRLPSDERYHALAAELQGNLRADYATDPLARAMVVKRYLETEATYSFKRNYDGEADPTAAFLFSEEKLGYCVHLAHATTFLLRAMGVPSRVGAGYAVPMANLGGGSSLLIKSGDAHAWAEIYLEGVGWVPIEVTPEKTDVEPQAFAEKDLQNLLGEMARKEGARTRDAIQPPQVLRALRELLEMLPYLALVLVLIAYGFKIWRLLAPGVASTSSRPRIAYRAALDRLSAIGAARKHGESRERFAERVLDYAPSFAPLTSVHLADAFGSRALADGRDAAAVESLAKGVGHEVRSRVPRWRWVLGVLNPVSWFWSR